jgi:hypothetical protein
LHQTPLGILKVHYRDSKRKRKSSDIHYHSSQTIEKNQIPTKKKQAMLCLPAEFFLVVKFCHWATTVK